MECAAALAMVRSKFSMEIETCLRVKAAEPLELASQETLVNVTFLQVLRLRPLPLTLLLRLPLLPSILQHLCRRQSQQILLHHSLQILLRPIQLQSQPILRRQMRQQTHQLHFHPAHLHQLQQILLLLLLLLTSTSVPSMNLSLQQFAQMGLSLVAVVPLQTLLIVAEIKEECAGGHHAQVMEEDPRLLLPRLLLPRLHLLLLLLEDVQFVPLLMMLAVALALTVEILETEAVSSKENAEFTFTEFQGDFM